MIQVQRAEPAARDTTNQDFGDGITMTTLLNERIETGDVIEITINGDVVSALVLLAASEAVILDACDGSTPFVLKRDELIEYRKFDPAA